MTAEVLTDPRQERERLLVKARDIAANAEAAARELTQDEYAEIAKCIDGVKQKNAEIRQGNANRAAVQELGELLKAEEAGDLNSEALKNTTRGLLSKAVSLGSTFTDSDQYKGLMQTFGGRIPEGAKGIHTAPMPVKGGLKALVTSGQDIGSADYLVQPQRLGLVPGMPYVAPMLRQIITVGTTNSDKIEYAQINEEGVGGTVSNAASVAEATTAAGQTANTTTGVLEDPAGAGRKPESALTFRKASADVITVAHWMPVTKRALSDAAQIRTMIDQFLRRGLDREIDRLILNGDADTPVGDEEWNGILNTTGVQSQAFSTSLPETIRKAISKVTVKGGPVDAVLISPEHDEALDLLKDSNQRYYGNGPFGSGPSTIWGRPRIVVPALTGLNKFILGDFSTCVLWDREQAGITVTDSHADFFVRNLVAVLAEARAAFGIFNPGLLVVGATV